MRRPAGKASLTRACWRTEGVLLLSALPFKLLNDACQFVGPIYLNKLLTANPPDYHSYLFACE